MVFSKIRMERVSQNMMADCGPSSSLVMSFCTRLTFAQVSTHMFPWERRSLSMTSTLAQACIHIDTSESCTRFPPIFPSTIAA
ncbi:MAG: hypothetical protein A4E30_00247 [Methanomassiliicoccales archaeon PtaB.Bin215]|nr:MAG: hypothetical protein A4E30_00247 [Methanomassiliicoccales archaeon PtaB.Bin215]